MNQSNCLIIPTPYYRSVKTFYLIKNNHIAIYCRIYTMVYSSFWTFGLTDALLLTLQVITDMAPNNCRSCWTNSKALTQKVDCKCKIDHSFLVNEPLFMNEMLLICSQAENKINKLSYYIPLTKLIFTAWNSTEYRQRILPIRTAYIAL